MQKGLNGLHPHRNKAISDGDSRQKSQMGAIQQENLIKKMEKCVSRGQSPCHIVECQGDCPPVMDAEEESNGILRYMR